MRLEGIISCKRGDNVRIGQRLFVSAGCRFIDDGQIEIGDDVILGQDVRITADATAGVCIGPGVWIGDRVELRPGAKIGPGAMVCSGTVVDGQVPANAVVEGSPAKVTWYLR